MDEEVLESAVVLGTGSGDARAVGNHFCSVDVPGVGGAALADFAEGELGLAERLVVDVEGVGLAAPGGRDGERADPDAGWIFMDLDCRAGQADGIGRGICSLGGRQGLVGLAGLQGIRGGDVRRHVAVRSR